MRAEDPVTIVNEEVGGYSVGEVIDWGPATNPNPLIPGTRVNPNVGNETVQNLTVNRENFCHVDQQVLTPIGLPSTPDVIPCQLDTNVTVETPCQGVRSQLRDLDTVGPIVDDAIATAAQTADGVGDSISAPVWHDKARSVANDCASQIPAFDGRSAIADNELLAQVRNPSICPNTFGICIGEAPIGQTFSNQTQPVANAFVTPQCESSGIFVQCDPLGLIPGVEVPWNKTEDVANSLPDEVRVIKAHVDQTNQSTPFVHMDNYTIASGEMASCTIPGRFDPPGDSNTIPFTSTQIGAPTSGAPPGPGVDQLSAAANATNAAWGTFFATWIPINGQVTAAGESADQTLYQLWPNDGVIFTREDPANSGSPLTPSEQPHCDRLTPPPAPEQPTIES